MQRQLTSLCSRCRFSFFRLEQHPERWLNPNPVQLETRRFRGKTAKKPRKHQSNEREYPQKHGPPGRGYTQPGQHVPRAREANLPTVAPKIQEHEVLGFLRTYVDRWIAHGNTSRRLISFGILSVDVHPILKRFATEVHGPLFETPHAFNKYRLFRFSETMGSGELSQHTDIAFTAVFYAWAEHPDTIPILKTFISEPTIECIERLRDATDNPFPAERFLSARKMHRKVIMHVGPTNSGKTHNALRALASARRGVYAGPLRLLAYEIWERLNLGQIAPRGTDESTEEAEAAAEVGAAGAETLKKRVNPKHARMCNMVTGEERRIVSDDAGLVSCTVEMVSFEVPYDVAVIDEIQMLADEDRGGSWTEAVLGICASELHLCGEESAVPLVEALLKDTGDELIINRYQRLTPLMVEKESLHGDVGGIKKGDCVVTFSRSNIFSLKKAIEERTGLRCAVVYGKLPPELRSEQAALFNDPDSGYDVIIGSDAIGMGLNLKIKRIVFDAVHKWDGVMERPLSISQTKQIAGRAGRYGLHGDDSAGGLVTTIKEKDLRFLRDALVAPNDALPQARVQITSTLFAAVSNALPTGATIETIYEAAQYLSKLPLHYRFATFKKLPPISQTIDAQGGFTLTERLTLVLAPIPWRDEIALAAIVPLLQMFRMSIHVDIEAALQDTKLLETLTNVETLMKDGRPPKSDSRQLDLLESFHRVLVMYLWYAYRSPVFFSSYDETQQLKERVEKALNWALEGVSKHGPRKLWNMAQKHGDIPYLNSRAIKQMSEERRQEMRMRRR